MKNRMENTTLTVAQVADPVPTPAQVPSPVPTVAQVVLQDFHTSSEGMLLVISYKSKRYLNSYLCYSANSQKRRRCGECTGCTSLDCGKCKYCRDKTKFGGLAKLKKC